MFSPTIPLPKCVLEEIALDGLEGITVEGLWKRLHVRLKLKLPLEAKFSESVWNFLKTSNKIQFFVLPEVREPLKIFNRFDFIDPVTGVPNVPKESPFNEYPFVPITTDSIRGSCKDFNERKEIDKKTIASMSIEAAEEKWGRRLVIVASQDYRNSMLFPDSASNNTDITISNYCILERLGRARYSGEVSNGKYSLANIVSDSSNLHLIKKKLLKLKLIESQQFFQTKESEGGTVCQLMHLPRFYLSFKPRYIAMTDKIIEFLKGQPIYAATSEQVKNLFDESIKVYFKNLSKHSAFTKHIKVEYRAPYRKLYPNATEREWKSKRNEERTLTICSLRDPTIDLDAVDSDDNNDEKQFLTECNTVLEQPLLYQAYNYIRESKEKGVSEPELGIYLGLGKISRRALLKQLAKQLEYYVASSGRQKVRRFVLPEYMSKQRNEMSSIEPGEIKINEETVPKEETQTENDQIDESIINLYVEETKLNENNTIKQTDLIKEDEIETKITEIFRTKYFTEKDLKKAQDEVKIANRIFQRCNFLEKAINTYKFIDDPTKLCAALLQKEIKSGHKERMCKKTYYRMLSYLCVKKRIRLWRIQFKFKEKIRALTSITSNDTDSAYPRFETYIKQMKNRFILSIHMEKVRRGVIPIKPSVKKPTIISPAIIANSKITSTSKTNYGITPKFVRLRTLHEFLFYLVYENCITPETPSDEQVIDKKQAIQHWKINEPHLIDFDELNDLPAIYSTNIEWKMFVPPLPKHSEYPHGWFLVSDILCRMPLSIFIRVVNFTYEIRGLDDVLSHPIKKHLLLHKLPGEIQQALFHRRKYLFNFEELLKRFCCMGIAQTGAKKFNIIDQRFYFLNRRATLLNTITSRPGYIRTSIQDYTEQFYEFNSYKYVQTYWDDMYKICMSTKLNRRSASDGKQLIYKVANEKLMNNSCVIVQPDEAIKKDIGFLPGDRRGAAGLDTTMFAHLERNWSFTTNIFKPPPKLRCNYGTAVRYKKVRVARDTTRRDGRKMTYKLATASIRRRQSISRRTIKKKKNVYDDVDKAAIATMSSSRVEWNAKEDNFLLLCRLAQLYLSGNGRPIPSTVIRDLVHWHCKSFDKTSRACARRVLYIMKKLGNSRQINNNVFSCLGEIKENDAIHRRFGNLTVKLKKLYPHESDFMDAFKIHYIDLVYLLTSQYYNLKKSIETTILKIPNTLIEFYEKYKIKSDIYDMNTLRFDVPETKTDIEIMTIINLIHSTMCCNFDKTSWSIQLYEIYKDFTERQLSIAMQKVRSEQLISINKLFNRYNEKGKSRSLPLTATSYHLSITYQQQLFTRIAYELFDGSFQRLQEIVDYVVDQHKIYDFNLWNSTSCFLFAELSHKSLFHIDIDVPKNILIFDKSQHVVNETYEKMFERVNECDYVDLDESVAQQENVTESNAADDIATTLQTKLSNLPPESYHLMCIVNAYGKIFSSNECKINENGECTIDCLKQKENSPIENAVKSLIEKREIYGRISADEQRRLGLLPEEITIAETNMLLIFGHLISKSTTFDVKKRNYTDVFKQMLEIIDETLANNEKRNVSSLLGQDLDFDEYYDAKANKNPSREIDITDKQHIFHDFLYVKTCKISLEPKHNNNDALNIEELIDNRETVMENIVNNSIWIANRVVAADFVQQMNEQKCSSSEVHLGLEILGFIESKKELGATTLALTEIYEDKQFLAKILQILCDTKLIMKTGVCQLTYVHRSFVKSWTVNTYNMKRLERESIQPSTSRYLAFADSHPEEKKRKAIEEEEPSTSKKKIKLEEDDEDKNTERRQSERNKSKQAEQKKRTSVTDETPPPQKEVFAVKMAPWIRINGSLNRRVIDKYLGTILLYCIENTGLKLFNLCTRFYYLTPVQIKDLVDCLEYLGCIKTTSFTEKRKVSLFSSYETEIIGPASDLNEFDEIMIEPTIDAVTRMSTFIGNKKYKEDFI